MKKFFFALALGLFLTGAAGAQIMEFGMKVGPGGLSEIGFVYSEHYRVQPAVVVDLERRRLQSDDISVLLFLSQQSGTAPEMILRWRLAGDSWWVITQRLRLEPIIYYVPVPEHVHPGPPFGKAYGYYRKHPRGKATWGEALQKHQQSDFDDNDIRNLVQLRLVSNYYGYRAEEVMQRRERGEDFGRIIRAEYEKKHGKGQWKKEEKEERKREKFEKKHTYDDSGGDRPGKKEGWKKQKHKKDD